MSAPQATNEAVNATAVQAQLAEIEMQRNILGTRCASIAAQLAIQTELNKALQESNENLRKTVTKMQMAHTEALNNLQRRAQQDGPHVMEAAHVMEADFVALDK